MTTQKTPISFAVNKAATHAEIFLYGIIGDSNGVTAKDFVTALTQLQLDYKQINIRINSSGGDVFEGFAIINAIKRSQANITGYIDSVAASMAAIIALTLKQCYMDKMARLMTHKVTGGCYGTDEEMQEKAKLIASIEDDLIAIIATKAGITKDQAKKEYVNGQDKWLTASEAKKVGLITGIYDGAALQNVLSNHSTAVQSYGLENLLFVDYMDIVKQNKLSALKQVNPQLYAFKYHEFTGKYPDGIAIDKAWQNCHAMTVASVELSTLRNMSLDELWKANKLQRLKELDIDAFKAKLKR